jgi:quercetin dioxygenase-like cupin family protein
MIVRRTDKRAEAVQPGVSRAVLSHGERLMLVEVTLSPGTGVVPPHQHPHEQATYVVQGAVRFTVNGETFSLEAGESCLIESGVPHTAEAISDCLLLDTFSPPREDFL